MNQELNIPRSMAFIMDGNGRWATERGLKRTDGHKKGIEKINTLLSCALKYKIEEVTVYAFSTENWKRPKEEVDFLFRYLKKFFNEFLKSEYKNKVKVSIIGDISPLNNDVKNVIKEVSEYTKNNRDLKFNVALNYGGKDDILTGVKNIIAASSKLKIDELTFEDFVSFTRSKDVSNIDLLVRTGKEKRLSNFMPLQCLYSELYFTDLLWPDFNEDFFVSCLQEYSGRTRRFGGIKE